MAINLSQAQIDAALQQVGEGLGQYLWLQGRVAEAGDFRDAEFRRRFNRFYRVRRGPAWQDAFYSLMDRATNEDMQFRDVLHALYTDTGRYEASFASKLVATLDPSQPVIDAIVLGNVGLRLPPYGGRDRAARICDVHRQLGSLSAVFLDGETGEYLVREFRRTYPGAEITEMKMLDLVLWHPR
jgi:hypothetical protein